MRWGLGEDDLPGGGEREKGAGVGVARRALPVVLCCIMLYYVVLCCIMLNYLYCSAFLYQHLIGFPLHFLAKCTKKRAISAFFRLKLAEKEGKTDSIGTPSGSLPSVNSRCCHCSMICTSSAPASFFLHFLVKCTEKGIFRLKITEKEAKPDRQQPSSQRSISSSSRPRECRFFLHFLFKSTKKGAISAFPIENRRKKKEKTDLENVVRGNPLLRLRRGDLTGFFLHFL